MGTFEELSATGIVPVIADGNKTVDRKHPCDMVAHEAHQGGKAVELRKQEEGKEDGGRSLRGRRRRRGALRRFCQRACDVCGFQHSRLSERVICTADCC